MNSNFVPMHVYFFACYYSHGPHMEDLTVPPTFLVRGKRIAPLEYFLISELCHRIFIK